MDTVPAAMRLRQARLRAHLELSDIEQRTRISPSILRWIDQGQFNRLPAGIYARAYVRAFAQAVGLDATEILASLEHELPAAADITAAPASAPTAVARRWPEWAMRIGAACVDAAILSAIYALVLGATALVCGRQVEAVLGGGLPAVVVVLAVLTAIYFVVFAGVQGRTPGARFFGLPALRAGGPMHLGAIVARAGHAFVTEASLGIELAARRGDPSRHVPTTTPYGSRSTP